MAREIKKIVIHVTDSPDDRDIGFAEINQWHKERGFTPYGGFAYCGYHKVIRRSGLVEVARPDSAVGIHCSGHNAHSLAVVWVGKFLPSIEQHRSLLLVVADWLSQYKLEIEDVYGHTELNPSKTCPNLSMDDFREELLLEMNRRSLHGIP